MSIPEIMSLPAKSAQCRAQLMDFCVIKNNQKYRALPREVMRGEVIFELKSEEAFCARPTLGTWFRSLRAISLTATFLPCVSVVLYAFLNGRTIDWPIAALAILAAVLLQVAVNLLNDFEDYLRLIDLPGSLGGSGVLTNGLIKAKTLQRVAFGFLLAGILCGVPALLRNFESLIWIGGIAVLGVVGYSGKPFRFKYVALGDLSVFVLVGPLLTLGIDVAATGTWSTTSLLLGLVFGFLSAGILHANNMQDIVSDTQSGAQTLASKIGFKASRYLFLSYYVLAYACLVAGYFFGQMKWEVFLAVGLSLPLSTALVKRTFRASGPLSPQLGLIRILSAQTHLGVGVALIVALFVRGLALSLG